jgi:hypothetical protein
MWVSKVDIFALNKILEERKPRLGSPDHKDKDRPLSGGGERNSIFGRSKAIYKPVNS